MKRRATISRAGHVSIPAPIRKRWGTSTVTLDDQGDRIVLTPAVDDPIAVAEGALREFGPIDISEMRARAREDETVSEERRPLQ
jgi:bifunctional DNA-binding transcriptional regulator/antitoxin component of YhaV-PrlF toxin-antitoxin module